MITYETFRAIESGDRVTVIDPDDSHCRVYGVAVENRCESLGIVKVVLDDGRIVIVTYMDVVHVSNLRDR